MYSTRIRKSSLGMERQNRKMMELTASGENVPIDGIDWSTRWCTMPDDVRNVYRAIYDFEVKSDDVFVVTFPKCGTTWVQEAAWLLLNNLDFERAKSEDLVLRSVFMDLAAIYNLPNTMTLATKLDSPRLLKTHLPAHLIPSQIWTKKVKVIYCARNPKDVVVSFHHFHHGLGAWQGQDMDEFVDDFMNNEIMYTPFWPHVFDFWQMRHEPNVFFTTYEEMQRDLKGVLERLNTFLERPTLKEPELTQLMDHLSFRNMKDNKRTNPTERIKSGHYKESVLPEFEFMRRGIVGAFKDELSAKAIKKLDKWTTQNLADTNIQVEDIFGEV